MPEKQHVVIMMVMAWLQAQTDRSKALTTAWDLTPLFDNAMPCSTLFNLKTQTSHNLQKSSRDSKRAS